MKISELIELLKACDPEAYISLRFKDTIYAIDEIKKQEPGSDFNHNMIIDMPEAIVGKIKTEGLKGDTLEDWMNSPMSKVVEENIETFSTASEPTTIGMSNEELPDTILQPLSQIIEEEE